MGILKKVDFSSQYWFFFLHFLQVPNVFFDKKLFEILLVFSKKWILVYFAAKTRLFDQKKKPNFFKNIKKKKEKQNIFC